MKITKRYVIEHINFIRNDVIEIAGETRSMLLILESSIRENKLTDIDTLSKSNKRINRLLSVFDEENSKVVTNIKLAENDVRLIIGGMRVVTNMEKISMKIIRIADILNKNKESSVSSDILQMINLLVIMFDKLFIAFTYSEADKCYEVINDDAEVDSLRKKSHLLILDKMMKSDNFIFEGVNLISMIDFMERVGDYLVYAAQDIIFILSGEDIRYIPKRF